MDGARAAHGDLPGRLHGSGSGVFAESRNQDAGTARAKAVRKRDGGRGIFGEAPESGSRVLSPAPFAPGSHIGEEANSPIPVHGSRLSIQQLDSGALPLRT